MVWEQGSSIIVMLTNCEEKGRVSEIIGSVLVGQCDLGEGEGLTCKTC